MYIHEQMKYEHEYMKENTQNWKILFEEVQYCHAIGIFMKPHFPILLL